MPYQCSTHALAAALYSTKSRQNRGSTGLTCNGDPEDHAYDHLEFRVGLKCTIHFSIYRSKLFRSRGNEETLNLFNFLENKFQRRGDAKKQLLTRQSKLLTHSPVLSLPLRLKLKANFVYGEVFLKN